MTLAEFLLARIAEDEATARDASPGSWRPDGGEVWTDARSSTIVVKFTWPQEARHVARWSQARVLAECEAKRRIVEHCEPDLIATSPGDPYVLRLLALPYADHPDYDPTWKP